MIDYLFPTHLKTAYQWDVRMVDQWAASKKPTLTFAFNRFFPETLPREPFWLYLYYTKSKTEIAEFSGRLRYRFHVMDWASQPYLNESTYYVPSIKDSRVWFLIDRYQEVRRATSSLLAYEDFRHPEGKILGSCMRSSISPAICNVEINILKQYP